MNNCQGCHTAPPALEALAQCPVCKLWLCDECRNGTHGHTKDEIQRSKSDEITVSITVTRDGRKLDVQCQGRLERGDWAFIRATHDGKPFGLTMKEEAYACEAMAAV